MTRARFIRIIVTLFVFLSLFIGISAAQDINVDEMNRDELIQLLHDIMQKLDNDSQTPEPTESPIPTATATATPTLPEARTFQVYTNKQLIISMMPSYYFINPTEEPEEPEKPGKPGTTPSSSCQKECAEACYGISYTCYYDCYINCSGGKEPPPPKG